MSRDGKIVVAVIAAILVLLGLCACACVCTGLVASRDGDNRWEYRSETIDPGQSGFAAGVAGFQVPNGFVAGNQGEVMGVRWAELHATDSHGFIMLVAAPEELGLSSETIRRLVEEAAHYDVRDHSGDALASEPVQAVIRGQDVTLVRAYGMSYDGLTYQTLSGAFQGQDGTVLVTIGMPAGEWDQAAVDSFFASIQ